MNTFVLGLNAMALVVAGLFFLRFWRQTRDRLFLTFALAFWLLALTRLGLVLNQTEEETHTLFYLVRFGAYLFFIWAIIDKNIFRRGKPSVPPSEE